MTSEYEANRALADMRNRKLAAARTNVSKEAIERARDAIKRKRSIRYRLINLIASITA